MRFQKRRGHSKAGETNVRPYKPQERRTQDPARRAAARLSESSMALPQGSFE